MSGSKIPTECTGCSNAFTFMRSYHMCRGCELYFCHPCSTGKRPVPDKGHTGPVRVCDVCLHAVDQRAKVSAAKAPSQDTRKVLGSLKDGLESNSSIFSDAATMYMKSSHAEAMAALKRIYKAKIRPLEQAFKFSEFYDSELTDGDFDAKPFVLVVGMYSVGKTSFIRYLLEREDVPGSRIGPEPTTDRFLAVMAGRPGQADAIVPGNAAAVDVERPFASLARFGVSFLSRFEVSELSSPILDSLSFVDTPGVLAGTEKMTERGYPFEKVIEWFAARADRILLIFDAHKLDISDELKRVIESLKEHDKKIRIILNKTDIVPPQTLMRVYGALMFSLAKVMRTPEVPRVYLGSFWNQPINVAGKANEELFKVEEADLLNDLRALPQNSAVRKINELVKRARLAKVHALLVSKLRSDMPLLWGHKKKQERLCTRLEEEYVKVQKGHNLALGDFPAVERFRAGLAAFDLSEFPTVSKRMMDVAEGALARDIPSLLLNVGEAADTCAAVETAEQGESITGNPFEVRPESLLNDQSSFNGADEGNDEEIPWAVGPTARSKWERAFQALPVSGSPPKVTGGDVRGLMLQSGLGAPVLKRIWDHSDVDKDGKLDLEEFCLAMQLIKIGRAEGGNAIPETLPTAFIPPSKRKQAVASHELHNGQGSLQ